MQASEKKARSCRSHQVGVRLEREILALRGTVARLEEALADLVRPESPLLGAKASPPPPENPARNRG
jgi:hypothetical protein